LEPKSVLYLLIIIIIIPSPEAVATALHVLFAYYASVRASVENMTVSLQTWRSHECRGRPWGWWRWWRWWWWTNLL